MQLLSADGGLSFVAAITGLSNVEVLQEVDGGFSSIAITPPVMSPEDAGVTCPARTPFGLAMSDVDGDGNQDAIVLDPCGGNWVALEVNGGFKGVDWASVLPPITAKMPFISAFSWGKNQGSGAILNSSQSGGYFLLRDPAGEWQSGPWFVLRFPTLLERVTDLLLAMPPALNPSPEVQDLIFQGEGQFEVVELSGGYSNFDALFQGTLSRGFKTPYLTAFSALDHLASFGSSTCGAIAAGVGVFDSQAGKVPRRLQLLKLGDLQGAAPVEVAPDFDVTTFAFVGGETDEVLVGVIGNREGQDVFWLGRLAECERLEELAELPIEFDWRTPRTPGFGDTMYLQKTNGVKLLAARPDGQGNQRFVHYDGFDVRIFRASNVAGTWRLNEERYAIHADRLDLAFL
jgi:hypothetical protein